MFYTTGKCEHPVNPFISSLLQGFFCSFLLPSRQALLRRHPFSAMCGHISRKVNLSYEDLQIQEGTDEAQEWKKVTGTIPCKEKSRHQDF